MSARSQKSAKKAAPKAPSKVQPDRPPAIAYEYFLTAAQALAAAELKPCRGDLPLALHNVQLGVASVRPHAARLAAELPALELDDLWELPDLAAALLYADGRISGPVGKTELAEKLTRLRKLREPMLLIAEGLALWGLLPSERVAAIRAGAGQIDLGRDGIDLEALYREYATQIAGKHPFTAADLHEAADLGNAIVRTVTPQGGRSPSEPASPESQLRDRMYTLLTQRHDNLRKAGYYLFGEASSDYVPALSARVLGPRKPTEAPTQPTEPSPAPV